MSSELTSAEETQPSRPADGAKRDVPAQVENDDNPVVNNSINAISTPECLWAPTPAESAKSRLMLYQQWLLQTKGLSFSNYQALWQWSIHDIERFWESIWDFFDIQAAGSRQPVLASTQMPGARWYPHAELNYAEHVFRHGATSANTANRQPGQPHAETLALIARSESGATTTMTWAELRHETGALAAKMAALGISAGDRVASYMPNRIETVVCFLACASMGAIWSGCAPDMGASVVLDRFRQIEPKLLLATDSTQYNGKLQDRAAVVHELLRELPSIQTVLHVPGPLAAQRTVAWRNTVSWAEAIAVPASLHFARLPFEHPLWIVYSSGTTGLPKAMVHGHGAIVITHHKTLGLQQDIRPMDRMLFLGGTGWIVWNLQVGALLLGASIVLYDGNPTWPDSQTLWRFIDEQGVTSLGCGAALLVNAMKDGLRPRAFAGLNALRSICSTGSPLPEEAYRWVYANVKPSIWLASISGGTDIASGFVSCAPTLPVHAGEIQCIELGVDACAYDETGRAVVDEVGELVIRQPMPSMPLYFWGDHATAAANSLPDEPHGAPAQGVGPRYRESYFETFPGVWRHGDWIRFSARGSSVIYGRSDSTINRHGIRMGTAEIYRVVEELPDIRDSLVVDLEYLGRPSFMPLFVVLEPGFVLDAALKSRITQAVRSKASARHVPDEIHAVEDIPRTLTGKKMEVPVRKLLLGLPQDKVASRDAMANPDSLAYFVALAERMNAKVGA